LPIAGDNGPKSMCAGDPPERLSQLFRREAQRPALRFCQFRFEQEFEQNTTTALETKLRDLLR